MDTSPITIWAALKAVIWGKIIQIVARTKRNREGDIQQLEAEVARLQAEQRKSPQIDIRHKFDQAHIALNLSLTTQAEKHI